MTEDFNCPSCNADVPVEVSRDGWPRDYYPENVHKCTSCGVTLYMHGDEGDGDVMLFWLSLHRSPKFIFG